MRATIWSLMMLLSFALVGATGCDNGSATKTSTGVGGQANNPQPASMIKPHKPAGGAGGAGGGDN